MLSSEKTKEVFGMIQIVGSRLCQWDVGRSVNISDSKATHVHFANQGDSKAVIIEITNGTAKIPDYLLQTGKALNAYAVLNGVTLESRSFAVCKRERPENYVYEDDRRNYIYELITRAEDAVENANQAAQKANEAAEKLGSIVIPTKVSQLQNDSGFLTEAPVTSVNGLNGDVSTATKVSLTEQTDGSYLSDLSSAEIMAAYRDHKSVHCYHNKMILPLIRSVVNDAVFSGIYNGQIHTVNVTSNRVATVTVIPLASGGGSDGITPHIGANGNWWIGEEDTGVSAGVTDEQISDAVEEYMEDNPLVKTVNGTAPDENGNVKLDIPSGGGDLKWRKIFFYEVEEEVSQVKLNINDIIKTMIEAPEVLINIYGARVSSADVIGSSPKGTVRMSTSPYVGMRNIIVDKAIFPKSIYETNASGDYEIDSFIIIHIGTRHFQRVDYQILPANRQTSSASFQAGSLLYSEIEGVIHYLELIATDRMIGVGSTVTIYVPSCSKEG
jgi:hypothetical protein